MKRLQQIIISLLIVTLSVASYLWFTRIIVTASNQTIGISTVVKENVLKYNPTAFSRYEYTWYSSNYLNRKQITITGTADGAQTNYQMKLTVYKSTGTDGAGVVYLGTKVKDDFSDLIFTKSDGVTALNYWTASYTSGTSAVIWIEFDSIPASPSTVNFYIYYNYSSATSASNITATMIFGDDFSGTMSKWTQKEAGTWNVTHSSPNYVTVPSNINSPSMWSPASTTANNQCAEADIYWVSGTYFNAFIDVHDILAQWSIGYEVSTPNASKFQLNKAFVSLANTNKSYSKGQWYHIRFFYKANYQKTDIDGGSTLTATDSARTSGQFVIGEYIGSSEPVRFSNVFIRNWTTNEPTWGIWGAEESNYSITNTPTTKAFGTIPISSTYYAKGSAPANPVVDANCTFYFTNDSSSTEKVQITGSNFTGGTTQTLTASSPGADTLRITAYYSGENPASGIVLTTSAQDFYTSLAASASVYWDFKMELGAPSDNPPVQKTGTITLTAVAP